MATEAVVISVAQFFADPWTAFETEDMLVTMLLQDAERIGPTLNILIGAAFHDSSTSSSFRSRAQFRLLSALHRVHKILRHDVAGRVRYVVPPAVAFDTTGSFLPRDVEASTLGEQLGLIDANVDQLRQYMDERAEEWIPLLAGASSSGQLADVDVWAVFFAVLKDWVWFSRSRHMGDGRRHGRALEVVIASLPAATRAALESDSAPLARKIMSLIRTLIGSSRSPSVSIRNTIGSSLATLSRLHLAPSPARHDDPCEIIIDRATVDPDCRAALLIAHLELLAVLPTPSPADASCPTCACARGQSTEPLSTAFILELMSVNDKHLVQFLLAHLALFHNPHIEALRPTCKLPIVTVSPTLLFDCLADVILAHDALTMVDFLLDSADWIGYLSSFVRWAATAVSETCNIKMDASSVRLLVGVEKHLVMGSLPFNARPLMAAIRQCVAGHGSEQ